jgi:hypothetical protein
MVRIESRQVLSSVAGTLEVFCTALFSAQERITNKKKQVVIRIAELKWRIVIQCSPSNALCGIPASASGFELIGVNYKLINLSNKKTDETKDVMIFVRGISGLCLNV